MSCETDLLYDRLRRTCSVATVLDVGCGSGHLVYKLLENGSNAYGVDLVHSVAKRAASWTPSRFIQADAGRLPIPDATFDTVVAIHLLDYISPESLPHLLGELHRVCRRFLFATVSPDRSREAWDHMFFQHGFCRHPLLQAVVPLSEPTAHNHDIVLICEKTTAAAHEQCPPFGPGSPSDPHAARYQLAAGYIRSGDVVVDVGCGSGYGGVILADGSLASRVIGLDERGDAIEYASTVFAQTRPQLEFRHARASSFEGEVHDRADLRQFPAGSVDVVVSFGTLGRTPSPERLLTEAVRVLTPGGRLIASIPASWEDTTFMNRCPGHLRTEQFYRQEDENIVVAVKDPQSGKRDGYRETVYAETAEDPPNVTAYARDYENPWLVRSLVNISSRFRSPELLLEIAREVQTSATPESADMGAALCIEGYQLIRHTVTPLAAIDAFLAKSTAFLKTAPASPHAFRWHISLQFLIGKTQLLVGRRSEAKETFRLLSRQDVLPFSPLLGTKTINAAFYAGWLCALDGDVDGARSVWSRGVQETRRLLQGDWREIWGDPSNPLPFAFAEVGDVVDAGSRCAIALKHADRLHSQPGLFWRVMEEHSKSLRADSDRLRWFEQSARIEQAKLDIDPRRRELASCLAILRASHGGRPLWIWGAGSLGARLARRLVQCGIRPAGFIDSDPAKQGASVLDLPVHGPDSIKAESRPFVIIGSSYSAEIRLLLLKGGLQEIEDFSDPPASLTLDDMIKELAGDMTCERPPAASGEGGRGSTTRHVPPEFEREGNSHPQSARPAAGAGDTESIATSSPRTRSPRCLMFYPWNLNETIGALRLFLAYSKALKDAGYRLDCYAPRSAPEFISNDGLYHGIFDNVFVMPDRDSPVTRHLEYLGKQCEDPQLPDRTGRDEASMVAAGVLVSISDYDVVGIQYTRCHSLKQMLPPGIPVVVFTHDLDALVSHQEELIYGYPAQYTLEDEAARLKPFQLVTVVGPDDHRALKSIDSELPIVEAPFTSPIDETISIHEESPGLLLCISCAGPFHRLSFFWFWRNVWPKVRSARPECRLIIAGRLSDVALQLGAASDPQVSVLGVVDDIEPLYQQADVVIAPYYYGLGIKTKVIEALAKGIPVATTSLGIHNTHIQPGRDAVVSDDATEYANEVIKLISCPELRAELAQNGREYVRKWHDPQNALTAFVEAFDRAQGLKSNSAVSRTSAMRDLHEPLRYLIPWTVERCHSDGVRSVALYGAGSHTRILIPIWKSLGGPPVRKIIVTGEPLETVFMGYPVEAADRFSPDAVDGIVLSSHGYEDQMARTCKERWPGLKAYPIWRPLERYGHAAENLGFTCEEKIPAAMIRME